MTSKAETTFANSVHKLLPKHIYTEKMHNPYRGGTPDFYVEGPRSMLWIEYKFIVLPKRDTTWIVPELSDLQLGWLLRNFDGGYKPRVIIGCKVGRTSCGVIFNDPMTWGEGVSCAVFKAALQPQQQLADRIEVLVS